MATPVQISFESGGDFATSFLRALVIQFSALLSAAFAFVAGLAINEAVQTTINEKWPEDKRKKLNAKWLYAGIVVIILVVALVILSILTAAILWALSPSTSSSSMTSVSSR